MMTPTDNLQVEDLPTTIAGETTAADDSSTTSKITQDYSNFVI